MSSAQCCSQKISQALKIKDVDMQNSANEQLQFNENFSQIILRTKKSLEESDSSTND